MTYGYATMKLAEAIDSAHREDTARRRSLRHQSTSRMMAVRHAVGTGLVAAGELILGRVDRPVTRARPSRT